MDERRRHEVRGQNHPGTGYDANHQFQHQDTSYSDQITQRDRYEQYMDRTTQPSSAYHGGAAHFGNHGDQGQPYSHWQSQPQYPSHAPNMYIPQAYPNYYDQSRFQSGQTTGHLPYSGFNRFGNAVDRIPNPPVSQSLPCDRNTVDRRQHSWNNEMYSSRQTMAQDSRGYPLSYGATHGSETDAVPPQIPQGNSPNNYYTNPEMPVKDGSIKDPYNAAIDRRSLPMHYDAANVTPGLEPRLNSSKSEVPIPPTSLQNYSGEVHQSKFEPPANVPLPICTGGVCPLPASTQQNKDMSDVNCKQYYRTEDSHNTRQKAEESHCSSGHSSFSENEKLPSSSSKSKVPVPPTFLQNYTAEVHQSKFEPSATVPLPILTSNSTEGACPLSASTQQDKDMSDVRTKNSHNTRQKAEESHSSSGQSSFSVNEKLPSSSSSRQDNVKIWNSIFDKVEGIVDQDTLNNESVVTGDERKELSFVCQESLDHLAKTTEEEKNCKIPADSRKFEDRTIESEKTFTASESKNNTKEEISENNVKKVSETISVSNTGCDLPVSSPCHSGDTCLDLADTTLDINEEKESLQKRNVIPTKICDGHSPVKERNISTNTHAISVRTTVDLSASEVGCSTVVKFKEGTCKYVKGEPTSDKEEETFYCSSQQDGGPVSEPENESSEEDNRPGVPGEDSLPIVKQEPQDEQYHLQVGHSEEDNRPGVQGEDSLPIVKQEPQDEQYHPQVGHSITELQVKDEVKLEVGDKIGSQSPTELSRGGSDTSRDDAVPVIVQGNILMDMDCNYDSDTYEVSGDKQDVNNSFSTGHGVDDDGMFDRCTSCNELVACGDMIEHPFKCKAKPNPPESPVNLPTDQQPPNDDEAEMNCPECGVGFETTDFLVIHLQIHEMLAKNAKKMQEENQMMVMTTEEMEKQMTHIAADITEEQPEECEVCFESFTDPTMIPYHTMMHQQFPFHCRKCNLFFNTLTELHKARCSDHKRHKVFKYRCKKCKRTILDSYKMRKHRKRCEGNMETCRLCKKKFPSFRQLAHHAEICNEDQMKKIGEDGREINEKDIVLEETLSENEDADLEAVDRDALDHRVDRKAADSKPAGQDVIYHDTSLEMKLDSRPAEAEIKEANETTQLSEGDGGVVRCKVCERELHISLRYPRRACMETPEYCKACLHMVRSKNLSSYDKSSASKKGSHHKRMLPLEGSSSNEETCENAITEPSTKKHKNEPTDGETCGACGRWFKNFEKLEKHAGKCDGVMNKHSCLESTKQDDDLNLDWKYPTVHRCPKCDRKFFKEKKLKKHVKSCLWIQDSTSAESCVDSSALVDDASDQEDELPLSALKNTNGTGVRDSVGVDTSDNDDHTPVTLPDETLESSNESSRIESMSGTEDNQRKEDKGEFDQNTGDIPKECATNGSVLSHQNKTSFIENSIILDNATHVQSNTRTSCNPVSASGLLEENLPVELKCDTDTYNAKSKGQVHGMEISPKSNFEEGSEKDTDPSIASTQQVTLGERETVSSTSEPTMAVPAPDETSPTDISSDDMPQQHLSQGNGSQTSLGETMTPSYSSCDNYPRTNVPSFTQAEEKMERVSMDSAHSAPKDIGNAETSSSSPSALSLPVNVKEEQHMVEESESCCPEVNKEEMEGMVYNNGDEDTESCPMDEGVTKSSKPELASGVADNAKSISFVDEAAWQFPGQSTDDEDTRGSMSQTSSNLLDIHTQGTSTTAPPHQESAQTGLSQDSSLNANQASVEMMSGIKEKGHFSGLKDESSMGSSLDVEYTMGLGAVKTISLECEVIPGHHCVYCAAEFPSKTSLWKHARGCRDNHLKVIANRVAGDKEYQQVNKPGSMGNVPWQVLNDYTKKEAMIMKTEIGIDLNCVIPAVGYRAPPNRPPDPDTVRSRRRKKKKKSKVKEDVEVEKKRKIERKKRRVREIQREKLRVHAKLQQLEQNNVNKFRNKEQQTTFTCELCDRSFHSTEKFEKHKVSHVSPPHKKTLAVYVEKLNVEEIEDGKKSTTKPSGSAKLKDKESSKKKHSKLAENKSVAKKTITTTKQRLPQKKDDKHVYVHVYVDVESVVGSDTEQASSKKNTSREIQQSAVKPDVSVPIVGSIGTAPVSVEDLQQADAGILHGKAKGVTWKKNEFGVQFPVAIEVECPDCQMKFSHQSTLDRHRRLHRK
eukprot:XP_003730404.1 PREDICTED: uncharacterized protein LOC100887987 isoform X1 [Strongylocentrotus purpuratus]